MQIDMLDFIQKDFLKDLMNHISIRVGHMENNYGDAHFRRSDNAQALYNPLVGNLIMDGFTTEVGGEITYQNQGWIAMASITNGKLNQSVAKDRKSTRLNSSHVASSYAVFCLEQKKPRGR